MNTPQFINIIQFVNPSHYHPAEARLGKLLSQQLVNNMQKTNWNPSFREYKGCYGVNMHKITNISSLYYSNITILSISAAYLIF